MTKKYILFDFQDVINLICDKTSAITKKSDLVPGKVDFLKTITDKMQVEDMPFYTEHLVLYDLKYGFDGLELLTAPLLNVTMADYELFQRLVYASKECKYEFIYNAEKNMVELQISAGGKVKRLHELSRVQVKRLIMILFDEQISLHCFLGTSMKEVVEELRRKKLREFENKAGLLKNQKKSVAILSDLEDLLNS